jgi:hypothetical protein
LPSVEGINVTSCREPRMDRNAPTTRQIPLSDQQTRSLKVIASLRSSPTTVSGSARVARTKAYLKEHPEVEATIRAQGGLGADAGPGIDLLDEDHEITVD